VLQKDKDRVDDKFFKRVTELAEQYDVKLKTTVVDKVLDKEWRVREAKEKANSGKELPAKTPVLNTR